MCRRAVSHDHDLGGMAYPSFAEVQRVAAHCLKLFDRNPESPGAQHAQSQRFLNPHWKGLRPESNDPSKGPPLRLLMESIACGETTLADYVDDESPQAISLLRWVSAFRHVVASNLHQVPQDITRQSVLRVLVVSNDQGQDCGTLRGGQALSDPSNSQASTCRVNCFYLFRNEISAAAETSSDQPTSSLGFCSVA